MREPTTSPALSSGASCSSVPACFLTAAGSPVAVVGRRGANDVERGQCRLASLGRGTQFMAEVEVLHQFVHRERVLLLVAHACRELLEARSRAAAQVIAASGPSVQRPRAAAADP